MYCNAVEYLFHGGIRDAKERKKAAAAAATVVMARTTTTASGTGNTYNSISPLRLSTLSIQFIASS